MTTLPTAINSDNLTDVNANTASENEVRLVRVDKIASSTVNLNLDHRLEITTDCEARAGNVVVVRTLTDNATYNTLELVTGRMAKINPGDVIATGTPPGVGPLHPGDVVEVEVEGIGVLVNRVVSP